jgi:hypothetical protein
MPTRKVSEGKIHGFVKGFILDVRGEKLPQGTAFPKSKEFGSLMQAGRH